MTGDLRRRLHEGPVLGTFLKLPRQEVVEILSRQGFDFVICDLEHAQMDERDARLVILAGRAVGLPVIVRVASPDRGVINRLLECGAEGIQLPRTKSPEDTGRLRDLMTYPPDGSRSVSQAQPAAGFGAEALAAYLQRSNSSVLTIGQFETAHLVEPLDEAVKALDVAFIGSVDLSVDVGCPGDLGAPEVQQRIALVEEACGRTGTALGVFAGTAEEARTALSTGYRYIALASDLALLRQGASSILTSVREQRA